MAKINTDEKLIKQILSRGVDEVIDKDSLETKLKSGKKLRIKLGIDPTSPNIHLGRTIPLLKLKDFQDLGHQIVFIVGDFTGVIGDTSDKDSERPMLSKETIKKNLKTYKKQVSKILDINKVEWHKNSTWLKKLNYDRISEHANFFSVNQFIQRDNIRKRLKNGKRVSLREVLYPLMQGYDSVAVKADVEIGGTDQRFNLLAGREIQKQLDQTPQEIITNPLIEGLDGRKMSSSWGNTVNLTDSKDEMFGKIMSLRDESILNYFLLLTRKTIDEIAKLKHDLESGTNPKDIKMILAHTITSMYHGEKEADKAKDSWQTAFEKGLIPENTKTIHTKIKVPISDILLREGLIKSKTEFRKLVEQGAIKFKVGIEEKKIVDPKSLVEESGALKIGKKRFLKIKVEGLPK